MAAVPPPQSQPIAPVLEPRGFSALARWLLSTCHCFMTDRWQQIESLCQSALELKESLRVAFLDAACAGDEELRREVESLLRFEKPGDRFIEEPAVEVARLRWLPTRNPVPTGAGTRTLPDPFAAGCRRHGGSVSCPGRQAEPRGGAEGAA